MSDFYEIGIQVSGAGRLSEQLTPPGVLPSRSVTGKIKVDR